MTYNPFREPEKAQLQEGAQLSAEAIKDMMEVMVDPKDQQIADTKERFNVIEFANKHLEEAVARNEKKITTYRERLIRLCAGHVHAKYDGCEPDCPKWGGE